LNVHGVNDVRQAEIHAAETLVPGPSVFEVELTIEKLKSHRSRGIDQIPAELIKAGRRTIRYAMNKLIISAWNKDELPEEWKESIIVPIYKKEDKRDCNNYRGISLLPTTYKILSNILLSNLIPYAEEVIGVHQCGFRHNRSTIHWTYHKPKMIKGSVRCYIRRSKCNILPSTLPRITWNTTTVFRLPRCLHYMKCYFINRINNFILKCNNIPIHHMRKNRINPTNSIPYTYKKLGRMITKLPTRRTQIFRATNYFVN
jgi:hypothetical protein